MQKKLTFLTIVVAILALVNAYFFITVVRDPLEGPGPVFTTAEAFVLPQVQVSYLPILDTGASEVELDAKSAILYDVRSDRNLFEKDIKEKLPVASLTKIVSAIVVWEKFSPSEPVIVRASAIKVDGERQDLYENETMSVRDLVQLMLIQSSNDAAYALRDHAAERGMDLIEEMNLKAAELGMRDTRFVDAAGLNDLGYSTAADLVKAVRYALRYDALWSFSREPTVTVTSADGKFSHAVKNTNQLLGALSDIVGGKTGYTDSALGCMILIIDAPSRHYGVTDPKDRLIAVVLGSRSRFEDMRNLVSWAKRAYRWQ